MLTRVRSYALKSVVSAAILGLLASTQIARAEHPSLAQLNADERTRAEFDWMMTCQGCHGPGGEGSTARKVPPLPGEISKFLLVPGGREYLVQVPGSAGSPLNDERLALVLNWMVLTLDPEHIPEDWALYNATEVSELRQTTLRTNATAKREQLLAELSAYLKADP